MNERFRPGEPAWIELCTTEPGAAEIFYAALLGWECRREPLAAGEYRMCTLDGRDVAGIADANLTHAGVPQGWLTYFAVEDAKAATDRARALGCEVVMAPRYLPNAGTGSVVVDPFGATLGLYEGEARAGVEVLDAAGSLCWNELATSDPAQSIAFYRELFGYGTERRESPTGRPYTVLQLDDLPVAGVLELEGEWPNVLPARWVPYLSVASIGTAVDRVLALGGATSIGPVGSPYGVLHVVRDPEGNALYLIELEAGLRRSAHLSTMAGE